MLIGLLNFGWYSISALGILLVILAQFCTSALSYEPSARVD